MNTAIVVIIITIVIIIIIVTFVNLMAIIILIIIVILIIMILMTIIIIIIITHILFPINETSLFQIIFYEQYYTLPSRIVVFHLFNLTSISTNFYLRTAKFITKFLYYFNNSLFLVRSLLSYKFHFFISFFYCIFLFYFTQVYN